MIAMKFRDVCKMASNNDMRVLIKDKGYALCDDQLKTLVTTNNLTRMAWYIDNCEILGIIPA